MEEEHTIKIMKILKKIIIYMIQIIVVKMEDLTTQLG